MSLRGVSGEQRREGASSVDGILERLDSGGRAGPLVGLAFVRAPVNGPIRMPRRPEAEPPRR